MSLKTRLFRILLLWGGTCTIVSPTAAMRDTATDDPTPSGSDSPPEAELDAFEAPELDAFDDTVDLMFEEFDVVVTAGRTTQPIQLAGAPVSVLSSDDILYSGVRSVPELFDFIPGVDALRIDRNLWAVGVRGMHQEFSDRTLVLLNGRNESNALYGGVDFQSMPIFIENIDRVEVVRGPGGAAWGANAFNGVINIIEKSPEETAGVLLSSTVNEFGDSFQHLRVGFKTDALALRFSAGVENLESSREAISGHPVDAEDFSRTRRFDMDGVYNDGGDTTLEFGAGYSHIERGSPFFLGLRPFEDERLDTGRGYAKLNHRFSDSVSGYVQWYGLFEDVNRPSLFRNSTADNTIDAQLQVDTGAGHELTFGITGRIVNIENKRVRSTDLLGDITFNEQWFGIYAMDRWQINDHVAVEGQIRADWYSETQWDWSGRASLLYSFNDEQTHVARFSAAKAFRIPQGGLQELATQRLPLPSPPLPPGTFGANLFRAGELEHEQIWSLEAGYSGRIAEDWSVRVDAYAQRYENMTGARNFTDPFNLDRVLAQIDTTNDADAIGGETQIIYDADPVRITAWYALNTFDIRGATGEDVRAYYPATHKVGVGVRVRPKPWWVLNSNYRYSSPTHDFDGAHVTEYHRFDLTNTFQLHGDRATIQFGVLDLFDETRLSISSISSGGGQHETPGRTIFANIRLTF